MGNETQGSGEALVHSTSVPVAVAQSVAAGLVTLIRPAALHPVLKAAYRLTAAGAVGTTVWWALGKDEEFGDDVQRRVAWTAASSGVALGLCGPAEAIDEGIHRWLERRGVVRPRVLMAAGAVAFGLVTAVLERRLSVYSFLDPSAPADAGDENLAEDDGEPDPD